MQPLCHIKLRILPNKCARRGGKKWTLHLGWFQWQSQCGHLNNWTLYTENMIQISHTVSEIQPVKFKSWGRVYSSRCIYSAKYSMRDILCYFHCMHNLYTTTISANSWFWIHSIEPLYKDHFMKDGKSFSRAGTYSVLVVCDTSSTGQSNLCCGLLVLNTFMYPLFGTTSNDWSLDENL